MNQKFSEEQTSSSVIVYLLEFSQNVLREIFKEKKEDQDKKSKKQGTRGKEKDENKSLLRKKRKGRFDISVSITVICST